MKGFPGAPIRHRGQNVGIVNVSGKEDGLEFTHEDGDTLLMFASQAAMTIASARRHQEEQQARADLETLINTLAPWGWSSSMPGRGPGVLQHGG